MSTSVLAAPPPIAPEQSERYPQTKTQTRLERLSPFATIIFLTALALIVHGYHPYAEDGGLYAAGIKRLLNPALYPHSRAFVDAHLRYSLFAPTLAAAVRLTHFSLPVILLMTHFLSIAATLYAVWLLASRCYTSQAARLGAMTLTAVWLTVPVAGTSLILMDPYVTARSISLPCTLLALAAALDLLRAPSSPTKLRSAVLCAVALLIAALAHPLMTGYALGDVLLLATILSHTRAIQRWGTASMGILALASAGILQAISQPSSAVYTRVVETRSYWFLSCWRWYEIIGLAAPLFILAAVAFYRHTDYLTTHSPASEVARRAVARMALASGTIAILVALAFAHESSAVHIVASLQPLRSFQTIYAVMICFLGALAGDYLLRRKPWRWIVTFALLGGIMFTVQRSTYPSSAHIEWPGATPVNPYEQAFLWISRNTLVDALFAMDADYISQPGEDAQSFRALAERSALPDYSKDGGEASITPALALAWATGQQAQTHLSADTDAQRRDTLRPLNVNWILLQQHAQTGFNCPYRNTLVKVCRLP